jgi:hypothetical protein
MEVMSELVMKQSVVQGLARIQASIKKMGSRRLYCLVQFVFFVWKNKSPE